LTNPENDDVVVEIENNFTKIFDAEVKDVIEKNIKLNPP